ncbi:SHOCT domain-containing protein [Bacillus cereus]
MSNKGQTQSAATTSGTDEILTYKELLDKGIITEEEF